MRTRVKKRPKFRKNKIHEDLFTLTYKQTHYQELKPTTELKYSCFLAGYSDWNEFAFVRLLATQRN